MLTQSGTVMNCDLWVGKFDGYRCYPVLCSHSMLQDDPWYGSILGPVLSLGVCKIVLPCPHNVATFVVGNSFGSKAPLSLDFPLPFPEAAGNGPWFYDWSYLLVWSVRLSFPQTQSNRSHDPWKNGTHISANKQRFMSTSLNKSYFSAEETTRSTVLTQAMLQSGPRYNSSLCKPILRTLLAHKPQFESCQPTDF